jgi:NAD(P)-dependent dehydrogenase (short-subunit alcohol dehydrogenase family)
MELEGRVALVTGASRGIGAAIARRLASEGAAVAAVARSLDEAPKGVEGTLRETVAAIEAAGGRGRRDRGRHPRRELARGVVARCRAELGPIDILVNNATFGPYRKLETFRDAREIERTLESSVGAPLHLVQLVLPDLRAKGAAGSSTSRRRPLATPRVRPISSGSSTGARISTPRARPPSTA